MIEIEARLETSDELEAELAEEVLDVDLDVGIVPEALQHIAKISDITTKLKDTAYNGWTPSTTAKAIITGGTIGTFTAKDIKRTPYYIRLGIDINLVYNEGTSNAKGKPLRIVGAIWQSVGRRSSNESNLNSGTLNANVVESVSSTWLLHYFSAANTKSVTYGQSYAFYPANVAATVSSTTAEAPTVTAKGPTINARCNASYMSTTMANAIDQDKSTIRVRADAFRVRAGYERNLFYHQLDTIWNEGLDGLE